MPPKKTSWPQQIRRTGCPCFLGQACCSSDACSGTICIVFSSQTTHQADARYARQPTRRGLQIKAASFGPLYDGRSRTRCGYNTRGAPSALGLSRKEQNKQIHPGAAMDPKRPNAHHRRARPNGQQRSREKNAVRRH